MRWYILRTLLHKELLRHIADRGGLLLSLLLMAMALLLSFGKANQQAGPLIGDLNRVYVVHEAADPAATVIQAWKKSLEDQAPEELRKPLRYREASQLARTDTGRFLLAENSALIKLVSDGSDPSHGGWRFKVEFWYPGDDNGLLAPFEAWFWKSTRAHFNESPIITEDRRHIEGSADIRSSIAAALVLFAIFFTCVYLLPSLTCEERERGVLLAQALSPASPLEILAAKFLFYPVYGIGLAAVLAGIYRPAVLLLPVLWLSLTATALASLGIGMCIASLARTQRLASLGALCYMLMAALFLLICQQNGFGFLANLALEFHAPRVIHAVLADNFQFGHLVSLCAMGALAIGWASLAVVLFRRRGWQ
jgi:hypothetical protein